MECLADGSTIRFWDVLWSAPMSSTSESSVLSPHVNKTPSEARVLTRPEIPRASMYGYVWIVSIHSPFYTFTPQTTPNVGIYDSYDIYQDLQYVTL